MKKIIYSTLLILLALTLSTCDKNDCQNCYPTVFECKVDGKTWKTSCESKDFFGCTASDFKYYSQIPSMTLIGENVNPESIIEINVRNTKLKLGNNKLYIDEFGGTLYSETPNFTNCNKYILDTFQPNNLYISELDTLNQIIKGTFNFSCKDRCGKIKRITEGKFDVIYGN